MTNKKIKIAIIGTGNIGTDLCARMLKNPLFEVVAFVGRRSDLVAGSLRSFPQDSWNLYSFIR